MPKQALTQRAAERLISSGQATRAEVEGMFDIVPDAPVSHAQVAPQAPNQQTTDEGWIPGSIRSYIGANVAPFVGVAKSAGETALGLGSAFHKIPLVGAALDDASRSFGDLIGINSGGRVSGEEAFSNHERSVGQLGLERNGLLEKTGALAEQVAEFEAMAAARGPAWLATLAGPARARLVQLAATSPRLARLLTLGAESARGAVTMGSVAAARGDSSPTTAAIGGAVAPMIGAGAEAVMGQSAQLQAAKAAIAKVLQPNRGAARNMVLRPGGAAENLLGDMPSTASMTPADLLTRVQSGDGIPKASAIPALSTESLGQRAANEADTIGGAIELAHDNMVGQGATIPLRDIHAEIDTRLAQLVRPGQRTVITGGVPITIQTDVPLPGNEGTVEALESLKNNLAQLDLHGTGDIPYAYVLDTRRALDSRLARSGVFDKRMNVMPSQQMTPEIEAQYHAANSLRSVLNRANSAAAELNAEFGPWADVERLLTDPTHGASGRGMLRQAVTNPLMWAAGSGAMHLAGGNDIAVGALAAGAAMKTAKEIYQSTAYRTLNAATRRAIASMVEIGQIGRANEILTKASAAAAAN